MVSPELLRRYRFFGLLSDAQLRSLAMLSQEVRVASGEVVLTEGQPADSLYFILEGGVDLYYIVDGDYHPGVVKEVQVSEVAPGEPFGISAIIEPYRLTGTIRAAQPSRLLKIDARGLRDLFEEEPHLELVLMRRVAKAAMERLHAARNQLAAAWV